jgi:hypothetical protein
MLQLPPMKYPNTQRTVSGTVDVFPDDVVLNCDTSTGAVTINLAQIPYNATSGQGFWSTQYKLYINDISNNAGTNNITVVAGTGQTLNNQPTLVLNTNGASCYLMIAGNTEYSMFYAPASSLPPNFITVTSAQLTALIAGNNLIPNADYNISDAEFGSTPIIPTNVYVKAITTNTLSMTGQGYFYNADYQGVGNYSTVTGFTSQLGVWNQFLVTPVGSVVIWDNFHYVNITGVNIASNPKTDGVNWQLLPYSTTKGYIVDTSFISYNAQTNRILSRTDNSGNFVERTVITARNSLNFFKWGSVDVRQNNVSRNSILYNCNATTAGLNTFFGNTFYDSEVILGDGILDGGVITQWTNNFIQSSNISIPKAGGKLNNNSFERFNLTGDNSGSFDGNTVINCGLGSLINNDTIENNLFKNLRVFIIALNAGSITQNEIISSNFSITTKNDGTIDKNFVNNSILSIVTNEASGDIVNNTLSNNASLFIQTNFSAISWIKIESSSNLNVQTNTVTAGVFYFDILNNSSVILGNIQTRIGAGVKGGGITVSNGSSLNIDTFSPVQPSFYGNSITNESNVTIQTFSGASFFLFNSIDSSVISTIDTNGQIFNNNLIKGVTYGGITPSVAFPTTSIGLVAMSGNSTFQFTLDCSDPAVYDLPTQTLTIDPNLLEIGGVYSLENAGGLTIAQIIGLQDKWITEFFPDTGTVTFQSVAVGGASPPDIVSTSGAFAFNIVRHNPNLADSIFLKNVGSFSVVREANILL